MDTFSDTFKKRIEFFELEVNPQMITLRCIRSKSWAKMTKTV